MRVLTDVLIGLFVLAMLTFVYLYFALCETKKEVFVQAAWTVILFSAAYIIGVLVEQYIFK